MPDGQMIDAVYIERWKSEPIWFVLVLLISIIMWILLAVSIIGIIYALLLALFFFITHLAFIAYIRGSAVRISTQQFPDLHRRINELASRLGLHQLPEAYIMQAGGALNALATKLFRSKFLIIYSDLLEACGDDAAARDMIIGHELGHIRAGHLNILWLLLPGLLFPFIGMAYSRAREFTCDRYGAALCGDKKGALLGLAILAAGAKYGRSINLQSFVKQRRDLNTGLMTLGKWMSSHPPLSDRIAALEPLLEVEKKSMLRGRISALAIIILVCLIPIGLSVGMIKSFSKLIKQAQISTAMNTQPGYRQPSNQYTDTTMARIKVNSDFKVLSDLVEEIKLKTNAFPADSAGRLSAAWNALRPDETEPVDPFDGKAYGYYLIEDGYVLWSTGPDGLEETADDIKYNSSQKDN